MDEKILDPKGVIKKFGISPAQVFDYLVLVGDKSDNIPGVDKIGPKTAISLLEKYNDLESIINNIDNIKGKAADNLAKSLDSINIAKKLIKLKSDVDIDINIKNYAIADKDEKTLSSLISKYQLKSLADNFKITKATKNINSKKSYRIIDNESDLKKLLSKIAKNKVFAFDTETTSLDPIEAELIGFSFSLLESEAYYIPLAHVDGESNIKVSKEKVYKLLADLFLQADLTVVGQNIKYDINVLWKYNVLFKCFRVN